MTNQIDDYLAGIQSRAQDFAAGNVRIEGYTKKFRCAKCKRYHKRNIMVIAPRADKKPGHVVWCLFCTIKDLKSWYWLPRETF